MRPGCSLLGSLSKVIFFPCGFPTVDVFCKMDNYKLLSFVQVSLEPKAVPGQFLSAVKQRIHFLPLSSVGGNFRDQEMKLQTS